MEKTCTEKMTAATQVAQSEFVPYTIPQYFQLLGDKSLEERLNYLRIFLHRYRPNLPGSYCLKRGLEKNGRKAWPTFFNPICDDMKEAHEDFCDTIYDNIAYNKELGLCDSVCTDVFIDGYYVFSSGVKLSAPVHYVVTYNFVK